MPSNFEAVCQNDDCDRGSWSLRKHPSNYARGGPTCPDCGTSKIGIEPGQGQQAQQAGQQPAQQPQQAAPPQTRQQAGQGRADAPARQEDVAGGLGGSEIGELAFSITRGDEQEQTAAQGALLSVAGEALQEFGKRTVMDATENRERAKEATSDDISVAEQYVDCPECGAQLTGVQEGEFPCPSCGVMLRFDPRA